MIGQLLLPSTKVSPLRNCSFSFNNKPRQSWVSVQSEMNDRSPLLKPTVSSTKILSNRVLNRCLTKDIATCTNLTKGGLVVKPWTALPMATSTDFKVERAIYSAGQTIIKWKLKKQLNPTNSNLHSRLKKLFYMTISWHEIEVFGLAFL